MKTKQKERSTNRQKPWSSLMMAIFLVVATTAHGNEIQWTTSGTFDDGGTFSGFFDFDAVNSTSSDWSLSVMGGTTPSLPPFTYTPANSSFQLGGTVSGHPILTWDTAGTRFLAMAFDPNLTNAGGVSIIFVSSGNSSEFTFIGTGAMRDITAGTAIGVPVVAAVPERSSSLALMVLGVVGLLGYGWAIEGAAALSRSREVES